MDVQIRPDCGRAWTAIAFIGIRFAVVFSVLSVIYVLTDEPDVAAMLAVFLVVAVLITLATGIPMALWWRLRPGRVVYEVADGELRVWRGAKIVQRHPCVDITYLSFVGSLDWRELLVPDWFNFSDSIDGWPSLHIDRENWPQPRILVGPRSLPDTLLWGRDRCWRAEQALRQAVTLHGAVLRSRP